MRINSSFFIYLTIFVRLWLKCNLRRFASRSFKAVNERAWNYAKLQHKHTRICALVGDCVWIYLILWGMFCEYLLEFFADHCLKWRKMRELVGIFSISSSLLLRFQLLYIITCICCSQNLYSQVECELVSNLSSCQYCETRWLWNLFS